MTTTLRLLAMWEMGRTRLTRLLDQISDEKLSRRMHSNSSSAAFLIRHMGEVDRLFARNIFGLDITVKARTLGPLSGAEDFGSAEELLAYLEESAALLREAIQGQSDEEWDAPVTAEFGTIPKHEALARNISHTAYHAGQLALILKYAPDEASPPPSPTPSPEGRTP
jgi:uncharacterized damage-inducible protein DinB